MFFTYFFGSSAESVGNFGPTLARGHQDIGKLYVQYQSIIDHPTFLDASAKLNDGRLIVSAGI